jgi:hypothetical protein
MRAKGSKAVTVLSLFCKFVVPFIEISFSSSSKNASLYLGPTTLLLSRLEAAPINNE